MIVSFLRSVRYRNRRVQIRLAPRLLVPANARQALQLAPQQVNLLEVTARLHLLGDQRGQARLQRELHALHGRRIGPFLGPVPAMQRAARHAQVLGNVRQPPAHPVQRARLAAQAGAGIGRGGIGRGGGIKRGIGSTHGAPVWDARAQVEKQ